MNTNPPSRDDARYDSQTGRTLARHEQRCCPNCSAWFTPHGRQAYCQPPCRQQAYRKRLVAQDIQAATSKMPRRGRQEVSVYQCDNCQEVYLGEQWCPDCQRPCTRLGLGGNCPHCQEAVSIDQLLNAAS